MHPDLENMPLDEFCDYIESIHHVYIRKTLRSIEPQLEALAKNEGDENPFLDQLLSKFSSLADDMSVHIQKEGNVLFPYIKKLALFSMKRGHKPHAHFSSLTVPIQQMERDHGDAVAAFRQLKQITKDYDETGKSETVRQLYKRLQQFEVFVLEHVEVENKILFRKAVNLEAETYDNH